MVDTLNCLYCGKEFTPVRKTGKYCSADCKRDFNREKERIAIGPAEKIVLPTKLEDAKLPDEVLDEFRCPSPFPIDIAYWNDRTSKGLPTEFKGEQEKVCVNKNCNKKFKTQLQLMRFCSADCHPFL